MTDSWPPPTWPRPEGSPPPAGPPDPGAPSGSGTPPPPVGQPWPGTPTNPGNSAGQPWPGSPADHGGQPWPGTPADHGGQPWPGVATNSGGQSWPGGPPPATCYRHPGRTAGVTCRRCERPICPECMIQASVGWQCPECVRASQGHGRGRARQSRYQFNRPGARSSIARQAPITLLLILANVVVFIISHGGANHFVAKWGLTPARVQLYHDNYELFTSPWVHLSVAHIALNMFSLYVVGRQVEFAIGSVRYLVLYLGAAMGGSVAYFLIAPATTTGAGASGAIFGVFAALFVVARQRGLQTGGIVGLLAINLIYGFVVPGVGWQAHVGGLVVGGAVAVGFGLAERCHGLQARAVEVATCLVTSGVLFALMQLPSRHFQVVYLP